jgi:hypothetical protein
MPFRKIEKQLKNGARISTVLVSRGASEGKGCSVTYQAGTQGR